MPILQDKLKDFEKLKAMKEYFRTLLFKSSYMFVPIFTQIGRQEQYFSLTDKFCWEIDF